MDWNPSRDPVWLLSIVVRHWESTILLVNSAAGRVRTSWSAPSGLPSWESLAHRESGSTSRKSGYSCCSSDGTDHRGTGSPAPRRSGGPLPRWSLCSRSVCFVETETDPRVHRGHVARFQTLRWMGRDDLRRQTPSRILRRRSGTHLVRWRWYTRWSSTCRTRSGWPARGFPSRSAAARRFRYPLAPRGSWGRADCREARSRTSQQHSARTQSVSKDRREVSFLFLVWLVWPIWVSFFFFFKFFKLWTGRARNDDHKTRLRDWTGWVRKFGTAIRFWGRILNRLNSNGNDDWYGEDAEWWWWLMVVLAQVLHGWLVANYLMMSIASVVGLDRRRLAKFASRVVPSRRGEGEIFVKTFFFYFKRNQTEASAAIVSSEGTRGVTFPSFFSSDFDCIPKGFDEWFLFFQNNSTTLLDAIFAGSNIILLLLVLVRGEATTHKATID